MLYLLWGLLNVGLLIFFIAICFKATKLIRENFGRFTSFVFVFGLLSFMGHSNNNNANKQFDLNQNKTWPLTSNDSLKKNTTFLTVVTLEKTWISSYDLNIQFSKDMQKQIITPIDAYLATTGFISGTIWEPMQVEVNQTKEEDKFAYFVSGFVEWKLLGFTIYSQSKNYSGIISTK